ncbi:opacity protein-like surface antigen [Mesorhizobium soli]|uniref:hypothetical protein n=1 Tax=Pseudaminobacter soli (ex Li et al. 2025) TaxID=1295366 RepID=UPI0024762933|nr:hypothetical protein [Mesorhizobium soli]MDH6232416.1 opacity protein-like surface antigen [Mesorhizobium soli]
MPKVSISRNIKSLLLAALAVVAMSGASQAVELRQPVRNNGIGVTNQQLLNQLQTQQNEQMRQNYQQQQQFYREFDRPRVAPQQMDIPTMRPNCVVTGYPPGCH